MADRLSKGPLQVITAGDPVELNDVLRRIQEQLDQLVGLKGTITLYDGLHIIDDNGQILHGFGALPS
jgi:hypothetical protein